MKVTDKHVLFWGEWPSNWFRAEFDVEVMLEGKKSKEHFYNSEQYFMFMKAVVFGDYETAKKILATKDPKKAKALGREVKGYDNKVWDEMRFKIMVDANKAKYSQNKALADLLTSKEFDGKGYTESSPLDKIWGTGLGENHPDSDDESKWPGQNLLGKALDEVRTWLLSTKKSGK